MFQNKLLTLALFITLSITLTGCNTITQNQQSSYDECINQCEQNNTCIEWENCEKGVLNTGRCCKEMSQASCQNICVEKYK